MNCGRAFSSEELALVAEPKARGELEADATAARGAQATAAVTTCDFPGGIADYCLSRNGNTMTASFQNQQSGTMTGRARLGLVGLGTSGCTQGTQYAISPLGQGGWGATWYASTTVQVNSKWSSSFLYTSGGVFGRFCATI